MSDETHEISRLLVDALESAFGIGMTLDCVIVFASEQWLEHDSKNVIDAPLARILARISADHVRADIETRAEAKLPFRRRVRKPAREVLHSPFPLTQSNDSQVSEEAQP